METFAARLKQAMDIKGYKQSDLARLTGLDKSLIHNYLSGNYKPKSDRLHLLAVVLNVDEAWLMGYDVPAQRKEPVSEETSRKDEFFELFNKLTEEQRLIVFNLMKGFASDQ